MEWEKEKVKRRMTRFIQVWDWQNKVKRMSGDYKRNDGGGLETEFDFIQSIASLAQIEAFKFRRTVAALRAEQERSDDDETNRNAIEKVLYNVLRVYRDLFWPMLWHTSLRASDPERAYDLEKDVIACTRTMFALKDIGDDRVAGMIVVDFVHGRYNALGRPHFRATLIQLRTGNFVRNVQQDFVVAHSGTLEYGTADGFSVTADAVPTHRFEQAKTVLVNVVADAMSGWKMSNPASGFANEGLYYLRSWRADSRTKEQWRGTILRDSLTEVVRDLQANRSDAFWPLRAVARLRERYQYGRLLYVEPTEVDRLENPRYDDDNALLAMILRVYEQMRIDVRLAIPRLTKQIALWVHELIDEIWGSCLLADYQRRVRLLQGMPNQHRGDPDAVPPAPASPRVDVK